MKATWFKSTHSSDDGNCVEVIKRSDGSIGVRDSKDPSGPALTFTRAEIAAFLAGAKDGEFDRLAV